MPEWKNISVQAFLFLSPLYSFGHPFGKIFEINTKDQSKISIMDFVYDLEGNFLYRNLEIPSEDLPITVLAVVNQSYPGYVINDFVNQQDWGENIKYEITLGGTGKPLEILITEEGMVVFECES